MNETNGHTAAGRQHWNHVHRGRWSSLGFIFSFIAPAILIALLANLLGPFPVWLGAVVAMVAGFVGIGLFVHQERKWKLRQEELAREQRNARAAERDKQMMDMMFGHQSDH